MPATHRQHALHEDCTMYIVPKTKKKILAASKPTMDLEQRLNNVLKSLEQNRLTVPIS